jgi:chorismate mutase
MACRGLRGATTVEANSAAAILAATRELLTRIVEANQLSPEDVASAVFTVTADLTAAFPARAARELGWDRVALLDAQEIPVPGSLPMCIRVLVHCNTERAQSEMQHVYLRGASMLRPEFSAKDSSEK